MKANIIIISAVIFLFFACKSAKQSVQSDNKQEKTENTAKDFAQRRKEQQKEQKQLEKQSKEKKKAEQKAKKQKEKEQELLIKNAAKNEKKRIEQERKEEKELLLATLKENKKRNKQEEEQEEEEILQTGEITDTTALNVEEVFGIDNSDKDIATANSDSATSDTAIKQVNTVKWEDLSAMDKILYQMDGEKKEIKEIEINENTGEITTLTDKEKKRILKQSKNNGNKVQENIVKRTWKNIFPEKIERQTNYRNFYAERPKTILILYPYNRSDFDEASQMMIISETKELTSKGYYVTSAVATVEQYKNDTAFCSKYVKISDLKNIGKQYGVDAVLFTTLYRFDNPYWTTNVNIVAHYNLISAKTLDTLFSRNCDFNYDTPIPPKENHDKDLMEDKQQTWFFGIMQQMQRYAFADIPFGARHKKYGKDRKMFSYPVEKKYKINVKPS